jgi:two-component system chemotaxis response regulator CheY
MTSKGRTVLVVDDDELLRESVRLALADEGYDVVAARDGAHALEQLNGRRPALILLDLMMPDVNGFQFIEQLRQRGLYPGIPVLAVTAASQALWKAEWIEADGCLEKPFDIQTLLDTVDRLAVA